MRLALLVAAFLSMSAKSGSPLHEVYEGLDAPDQHKVYILETGADAVIPEVVMFYELEPSKNT